MACARAQQTEQLVNDVESGVLSRDPSAAYDAAVRLDDSLQAQLRAALPKDGGSAAERVLTWVPPAWDAFVFDQRAFVIGERNPRADASVMAGRLLQLDGLRGATVRMSAAAGASPGETARFYFFEKNINPGPLGNAQMFILGRPFWRADGDSWLTLARPDLLIASPGRDVLAGILGRVLNGSPTRALPPSLSEWSDVDRTAPLWGLRHAGAESIVLKLDSEQKLEVRCACAARPSPAQGEFQVSQPRRGVWLLRSDAAGLAPVLELLGLGNPK